MLAKLPLSLLLLVFSMLAGAEYNVTVHSSSPELHLSPIDSWTTFVTTGLTGAEDAGSLRGAAAKLSNHPDARLELKFVGTAIYWWTVRGPARGLMRICVDCDDLDGMPAVDEYSEVQESAPTISWSQSGLPYAEHRVVVSNLWDPRSRKHSDIVVGGIHYTRAECRESLRSRSMDATTRMRLGVILGTCVPVGALLLGYVIYWFLLKRRRARLAPSELWRQRQTGAPQSRMWPSFTWTKKLHLHIPRPRKKTEVTPYQLPPVASPEPGASRVASPMTEESQLESQITSISNSLSPVRTPARSTTEPVPLETDLPYTPVFSPPTLSPRHTIDGTTSSHGASGGSPAETDNTYSPIFTPTSPSPRRSRDISVRSSLRTHFAFPPRFSRDVRRKDSASQITPFQLPPISPNESAQVSRNSSLSQTRTPSQMSMQYPPTRMDSKRGLQAVTPSPTSPAEHSPSHIPTQRHSSAFVIVGGPTISPRGLEPPSPGYTDQASSSNMPAKSSVPLILNPPSPAHLHAQRAPLSQFRLGGGGERSSQPIAPPPPVAGPQPPVADPDAKTPIPQPRPRGGRRRKDPGGPSFQPPRQKTPPPPYHG